MHKTESFSSIGSFGKCKRQYYYRYVEKPEVTEIIECLEHGTRVHADVSILGEGLKVKSKKGKNIKENDERARKEVNFALKKLGKRRRTKYKVSDYQRSILGHGQTACIEFFEQRYALTPEWKLTPFFDDSALFRGILDYVRVDIDKERLIESLKEGKDLLLDDFIGKVKIIDWKTGKYRNERKQLNYYSLFVFTQFENLEEINCQNVFLTEEKEGPEWIVKRESMKKFQDEIVESIEKIRGEKNFEPSPSPLCKYCQFKETCIAEFDWEMQTAASLLDM